MLYPLSYGSERSSHLGASLASKLAPHPVKCRSLIAPSLTAHTVPALSERRTPLDLTKTRWGSVTRGSGRHRQPPYEARDPCPYQLVGAQFP